ncbi:hypothetical protein KGF54_000667 [Candida jiufengensis]|uniref:uncharacterized protein n=1 Tax=Candida jiufengensis TaxID=497108 RepID=UPI0022244F87|nr:uncharacterized protein KGF54_000667 [Candida jiufengensis]KAI5956192.1 hypothetical protein KGF54_000667 [Candida jiufengensis]
MSPSITINNLLLDSQVANIASTVTPSLTNLHIAKSSIINNDNNNNSLNIDSNSIQTLSTTLSSIINSSITDSPSDLSESGLIYATDNSQLSDALGSFAQSSDVKSLTLSGTPNSVSSNNEGGSLKLGNSFIILNLIFTLLLYVVS